LTFRAVPPDAGRTTTEEGIVANVVNHFEIHGTDGKKSQDFYAALFGWSIDANNPMDYGMVSGEAGGIGGGISKSMDGKPMVTVYVEVADLDATLAKVQELGGSTVMPPADVPGGPRLAQFADLDGNVIGLTQAGTMQGA
jgi:predicted enzyme related to lactoylglutathione lyase